MRYQKVINIEGLKKDSFDISALYGDLKSSVTNPLNGEDVIIHYDMDGNINLSTLNNEMITDKHTIRTIKNNLDYKSEIEKLSEKRVQQNNEIRDQYINIYKKAHAVYSADLYQKYLKILKPQVYKKHSFAEKMPEKEEVENSLKELGNKQINSLLPLKKRRLVDDYVKQNIDSVYSKAVEDWKVRRLNFNKKEMVIENELNKQYQEIYNKKIKYLQNQLSNDKQTIEDALIQWINTLTFSFSMKLKYKLKGDILLIGLELPSIYDLPHQYAQSMANGIVKIKDKPKKYIKEEYYEFALGLSIYFASYLFYCAMGISKIIITGFYQNNVKEFNLQKGCIYSVIFSRDVMSKLNIGKKTVEEIIALFENRYEIRNDRTFKLVDPFEI